MCVKEKNWNTFCVVSISKKASYNQLNWKSLNVKSVDEQKLPSLLRNVIKDLYRLIHLQNESSFYHTPVLTQRLSRSRPFSLWHCGASVSMSFNLVWSFFSISFYTHSIHIFSVLFRFLLLQMVEWYFSLSLCIVTAGTAATAFLLSSMNRFSHHRFKWIHLIKYKREWKEN